MTDIVDLFEHNIYLTLEQIESFGYPTVSGLGGISIQHKNGWNYLYVIENIEKKLYKPLAKYDRSLLDK